MGMVAGYPNQVNSLPPPFCIGLSSLENHWNWPIVALSEYWPRMTQAAISVVGDLCFLKFFQQSFTSQTKYFFHFYLVHCLMMFISSRTLSNTLEMNLNNMALLHYSKATWKAYNNMVHTITYVSLITVSFAVRPTTAMFWLPLVLYHIVLLHQNQRFLSIFLLTMVPTATFCLTATTAIDSWYYGHFVLVPWNFFKVNILEGIKQQYLWHKPLHILPVKHITFIAKSSAALFFLLVSTMHGKMEGTESTFLPCCGHCFVCLWWVIKKTGS